MKKRISKILIATLLCSITSISLTIKPLNEKPPPIPRSNMTQILKER